MSYLPRFFIFSDPHNKRAEEASKAFQHYPIDEADVILVFGGDGTMIRAIHELRGYCLPFYGMNYGHLGFLLNADNIYPESVCEHELLLLQVLWEDKVGKQKIFTAVNDIWVERATAQTARMRVRIDDDDVLPNIYADGLLMCTAQGSTAYARSMGGVPLPLNTQLFQLVGNNVSYPTWKSAMVGVNRRVTITTHEKNKRPIDLYADGMLLEKDVSKIIIKQDFLNTVTLQFDSHFTLDQKIAAVQFPKQ